MRHNRHQVTVLDHAITSETALTAHLEHILSGQVSSMEVQRLDLVDDIITVDVRFRVSRHTPAELETAAALDDIASAAQPVAKPIDAIAHEAQTAQPWGDTRPNTAQAGSRPEFVKAQSLTMTPTAQYVIRSSNQVASSTAVTSRRLLTRMRLTDQTRTNQDRQGPR